MSRRYIVSLKQMDLGVDALAFSKESSAPHPNNVQSILSHDELGSQIGRRGRICVCCVCVCMYVCVCVCLCVCVCCTCIIHTNIHIYIYIDGDVGMYVLVMSANESGLYMHCIRHVFVWLHLAPVVHVPSPTQDIGQANLRSLEILTIASLRSKVRLRRTHVCLKPTIWQREMRGSDDRTSLSITGFGNIAHP